MRKFIFSISSLLIGGIVLISTNIVSAQVSYGVKLGPNLSDWSYRLKTNNVKVPTKMIVGLAGGVYVNLPIAPQFYVQPSLMYEGKGDLSKIGGHKVRLNYLTLPVDLLFKPELTNGRGAWIVGVGPYFGYGFSGKEIGNNTGSIDPFKGVVPSVNRYDAGGNVQAGYEMANGFNIVLHAELGLINCANNDDRGLFYVFMPKDAVLHNMSLALTLGYTFGKR